VAVSEKRESRSQVQRLLVLREETALAWLAPASSSFKLYAKTIS
jgi:hypothetical protein